MRKNMNQQECNVRADGNSPLQVPNYDRKSVKEGIVHIGASSRFFRAHLAVYVDDLLSNFPQDGMSICAVSLRSSEFVENFKQQECVYTLLELDGEEEQKCRGRVIGSITSVLGPEEQEQILEKMASPDTRMISLTITQPGYHFNINTNRLESDNKDIAHDIAHPSSPVSAIGFIARAMRMRMEKKLAPFCVLSCDNMINNGDITRDAVMQLAKLQNDADLYTYIQIAAFPNSMVDRITPKAEHEHFSMLCSKFGYHDPCLVVSEPFTQFVVTQDIGLLNKQKLESIGVQVVPEITPFSTLKATFLNATHTIVATVACLLGIEFVHEAVKTPLITNFVDALLQHEFTPLLLPIPGIDVDDYRRTVLKRFENSSIKDRISRVGADGSRKIPKYILSNMQKGIKKGTPTARLAVIVAAWLRSFSGKDEFGKSMDISDSQADSLECLKPWATQALRIGSPDVLKCHIMSIPQNSIITSPFLHSKTFLEDLSRSLFLISKHGVKSTLEMMTGSMPMVKQVSIFPKLNKKAVIFDCDLTLVNTAVGTHHCVNYALRTLGYPAVDFEKARSTIGLYMTESFTVLTGLEHPAHAQRFAELFVFKESETPSVMIEHSDLFPTTLATLLTLKHSMRMHLGIVTSKHRKPLNDMVSKFQLGKLFSSSITGDEVQRRKPAPDGLLQCIKSMNLDLSSVLYVGDSFVDAEAAQAAGVDFIGVTTGTTTKKQFAEYPHVAIVETLCEIPNYLTTSKLSGA